jgi:hypothetical protein
MGQVVSPFGVMQLVSPSGVMQLVSPSGAMPRARTRGIGQIAIQNPSGYPGIAANSGNTPVKIL